MSNIADKELQIMQRLINFGASDTVSTVNNKPILEYHMKAADGNIYGIIRESNKYYIKIAPHKDTEPLAEDYDYIGGINNKREYEYSSYALASKQFDLKMMSLNEAASPKKQVIINTPIKTQESDWQINETKEMRAEIERFQQLSKNVEVILSESNKSGFTMSHTLPEAPSKNPSDEKVNAPYSDNAKAEGDKDFNKESSDHKHAGNPYMNDGTVKDSDMTSDKNEKGEKGDVYTDNAEYVPSNSVANQKPSGGKSVKMNEGKKRTFKLTEEQVLAWYHSPDYMDKSKGTEIGDTAPYEENVNEDCNVVFNNDNQNCPTPGNGEVGDTAPYEENVNEEEIDVHDVAGMPDEDDEWGFADDEDPTNNPDSVFYEPNEDDNEYELEYDDNMEESLQENFVLNDFGKHPAYRKVPMTTPPNKEINTFGRDWNDDSAKTDQPFGKQIGSNSPYDEVVRMITDALCKNLNLKKKRVNVSERKVIKVNNPADNIMTTPPVTNDDTMDDYDMPDDMGNNPSSDMDNQFDSNFDAGIDVNEEDDPKRYIQQLTGKLSQSLRNYNNELPSPDADLNKYVAGMINKQALKGLKDNDVKDILSKINSDEEVDDGDDEKGDDDIQTEGVQREQIDEIYQDIISPQYYCNDDKVDNHSYSQLPFTSPSFEE